jgi:thiamine pyrophosphokinase
MVVAFTGRSPLPATGSFPVPDLVIAADSGVDAAFRMGLRVDVLVGDLDSASAEGVQAAVRGGAVVERHPASKDETDLELALGRALTADPTEVLVVAGTGGRHDHTLGNVQALSAARLDRVRVRAWLGEARLIVVRPHQPSVLTGHPGELVSLLPVHGSAEGVRTSGLVYPLADEDLPSGTGRGLSNVLVGARAEVSLTAGVLVAVFPGEPAGEDLGPDTESRGFRHGGSPT